MRCGGGAGLLSGFSRITLVPLGLVYGKGIDKVGFTPPRITQKTAVTMQREGL
jgi:hypothetical protein